MVHTYKWLSISCLYTLLNDALLTINYNSVETNKMSLDHLLQVAGNMLILSQVTFLATGCDY